MPWRRRRSAWAATAVGTLGILALAVILRPGLARHPPSNIGVVITPFEETGGGASGAEGPPGHVLFAEAVEWVPGLHALDGSRLLGTGGKARGMPLSDLLREAERLGGRYLVTGTVLP